MKKIFKFVPVALAAFALASCSSDDLFGDAAKEQKVKGGLTVNVEALMDEGTTITRQGNVAAGNAVVWEDGDLINVYDNKLAIYDEYAFDGAKFAGINDPNETRIENTQFALFPADRVDYAGWTAAEGAKAVMRIPELVIYDEESEFQAGPEGAKKDVYVSNLPMWGTATGTYPEANVDLKFLTSVLKINILNAFANNITFLKVETQDATPISGAFEAILDAADPSAAVLKTGASSLTTSNVMYVDLRNVPSYMTYIYLPIIAGHYDYMKVGVTSVNATEASPLEKNADLIVSDLETLAFTEDATTGWLTIRNWEAGVDFTKSSVKPLSKETQYNLDNIHTCEMITKALEQYKSYEGTLELNIGAEGGQGLLISRPEDKSDWTIYVPEMKADKVVLNIPDGIEVTAAGITLNIVDANIKKAYKGEIEINAAKVKTTSLDMCVNLPETDFTLAGDYSTAPKLKNIEIKNVDKLTIGNGTDVTAIAWDATLTVNTAKEIVINDLAEVRTPIDAVATKNLTKVTVNEGGLLTPNATLSVLNADVHVQGHIQGGVFVYASKSTTYIGENVADGQIGNLYTIGKVQIENKNESEAITGMISALGNNIINVKQGYVRAINYDNTKGGFKPGTTLYDAKYVVKNLDALSPSDHQAKQVTIHFMENEGNTSFLTIQPELLEYTSGANVYNWIVFDNASTWNGKIIDAAYADYVLGINLNSIYTACQLATQGTVDGTKSLYNDIDLNNKQWTNRELNRGFTGLDPRYANANKHASRIEAKTTEGVDGSKGIHTIKNLKLSNKDEDGKYSKDRLNNFGLFGVLNVTKDFSIQNFILDGVTCDLAKVGNNVPRTIGAVVGLISNTSTNAVTFKNIEVKNAVIGGDAVHNSGTKNAIGIIEASTFIGAALSGAPKVTITGNKIAGSVTGQAYLGGVIGIDANAAVEIDGNTINTTFSVPETNVPSSYDFAIMRCGTIGNAVGQFAHTTGTLKIGTATDNTVTDNVTNNRDALGFKYNFLFDSSTKYGFYGGNPLVGYSPNFTDDNLICYKGAAQVKFKKTVSKVGDKTAFNALAASLKQNAYIQWTPWEE
jgi:hypothetical protein